jgi:hypothetical protein
MGAVGGGGEGAAVEGGRAACCSGEQPRPSRASDEGRTRRRQQRIDRFAKRQRTSRQWIAVSEIADQCAFLEARASIANQEDARALAWQLLDQSARNGEFERAWFCRGRSKILYLDAHVSTNGFSPRCRLTREQLGYVENIRTLPGDCWLPCDVVRPWLVAHGYPWPAHFDPQAKTRTYIPTPTQTPTSPAVMLAAQTVQGSLPGDEALSPEGAATRLHGKALDDELDKWVFARWGDDLTKLPSRDELLRLARDRPEFSRVTQQDIRALRRRKAPDEIKRGGGKTHRRS